ncbi:MAG: hypothetical protein FGM46_09820 [Ferruginibacter sp.]|nr:hypothetical protein [Ferruginibacter sp.]
MQTHTIIPEDSLTEEQGKDSHFKNQFIRAFEGFYRHPQTMKELSITTGIDRANLCRYVRQMEIAGTIAILKRSYCSITKHIANKYTTNPELFPLNIQLSLFDAREGRINE